MRIGNRHVVITLEIDQLFVALRKLVGLNAKAVLDAFVFAIDALHRNGRAKFVAEFKIDDFPNPIFDVALCYQACLIRVLKFRARYF